MSAIEQDTIPPLTLGWRLQMAMRHADLTALDMAGEMEVGRDTVARWLHDETVPHRFFLQAWATRCGVNYQWLVGEESPKVERATRETAGRGEVTDNKKYSERGRKPARRRAETRSYQHLGYCRCYPAATKVDMVNLGQISLRDHLNALSRASKNP